MRLGPRYANSETVLCDGNLVGRRSIPVGIREDMFAVWPCRRRGNAAGDEKDRPEVGNCRWANDIMCALTERAVCVPHTVGMKVRYLDGSAENQQECESGDEQNANKRIRPPNLIAECHR